MVNPIKNQPASFPSHSNKKKTPKEIDTRIKKAAKTSKIDIPKKAEHLHKIAKQLATEKASLAAEKTTLTARMREFSLREAALKAQKSAFLAERAHLAQQAAAARRARAAEKAKKAAQRTAKKSTSGERVSKIKAYIEKREEKRFKFLKKHLGKKKKSKKEKNGET